MRLYHAVSVDARIRFEFVTGWTKEDRNHGLRDEQMNSVLRVEDRKAAMQSCRSVTSTSTVRHSGLSTSTMGSCGRVGQNDRHHPVRGVNKCDDEARLLEPLVCMPLVRPSWALVCGV